MCFERYKRHIRTLLPALGDEASSIRMYLRFLGSNGLCRPELIYAVPTIPRIRSESLRQL